MNEYNEVFRPSRRLLISIGFGVLLVGCVVWMVVRLTGSNVVTVDDPDIMDLQEAVYANDLQGELYITAIANEETLPFVYRYDFATQDIALYLDTVASNYFGNDGTYDFQVAYLPATEDPDHMSMSRILRQEEKIEVIPSVEGAYNEQSPTVSWGGGYYAYAYNTAVKTDTSIVGTNIAIHTREGGLVTVLENASEPTFLSDTEDLMFMREDGLYVYNMTTKTETLAFGGYTGLSLVDDYSVSDDGTVIVLTIPTLAKMMILDKQKTDDMTVWSYQEQSAISVDSSEVVRSPRIDPSGTMFAVAVVPNENDEVLYTAPAYIRFYNLYTQEVITDLRFEALQAGSVHVDLWKES